MLERAAGRGCTEAVLLSTCNRTELYHVTEAGNATVRELMVQLLTSGPA